MSLSLLDARAGAHTPCVDGFAFRYARANAHTSLLALARTRPLPDANNVLLYSHVRRHTHLNRIIFILSYVLYVHTDRAPERHEISVHRDHSVK